MRECLSTFFYLGRLPYAPGTFGSLGGVAVLLIVACPDLPTASIVIPIVLLSALNIWLVPWAEEHFGKEDPAEFVLDEVVGYLVTLAFLKTTLPYVAIAFIAFRIFDVLKPFPIKKIEKLPNGWGVLLDDVMAGVYANLCVRLSSFIFAWLFVSGSNSSQ